MNQSENGAEDLWADLTAIVYLFCARLYGQRRPKRTTEVIMRERELEATEEVGEEGSDATG